MTRTHPEKSASILRSGKGRANRRLTGHWHLGPNLGTFYRVVAPFGRTIVNDRVLFFHLRRESCWAPEFAAESHVDPVIGTVGHGWLVGVPPQNDIQQIRHSYVPWLNS